MSRVLVLRHVPHEALGTLEPALRAGGLSLEPLDCHAHDWSQPAARPSVDIRQYAGLVVMGGPMNVDQTEQYPFLAAEVEWIRQAAEWEIPTLGICLGAQLIAKAAGAQVYRNPVKEIGWYDLELLESAADDPLFGGADQRQCVFQWHGDTFPLPAGAVQLARGASCEQQAFRWKTCTYALQFHLEMTAEMIGDWFEEAGMCAEAASAKDIRPDQIRQVAPARLTALRPLREQVFARFAQLCLTRAAQLA